MRKEWMEDPNEKELLLSIDEVLATPNASKTIVQVNIDYAADCKASELEKIITMIVALYKNKKVTTSDIESAVGDLVEFIDSFACDNPRIFDYAGDMFCAFANLNVMTINWLCEAASKVNDDACKLKVIVGALNSIKKQYGNAAVGSCFKDAGEMRALEKLLGSAKLRELQAQFS